MLTPFWERYPALLYAFFYLLGCYAAFAFSPLLLIPLIVLLGGHYPFSKQLLTRLSLALILMTTAFIYAKSRYIWPKLPQEGATGSIEFDIQSLSLSKTPCGKIWIYKGIIRAFYPDTATPTLKCKNIPCRLTLPFRPDDSRPSAHQSYLIEGKLQEHHPRQYSFIINKEKAWYPLTCTWSLAELRFHAKAYLGKKIRHLTQDPQSAVFLTGMTTGEFDDRQLLYEFGRFGLQHILAISGFHFSIVAGVLSMILGFFFSKRQAITILILLLSCYFLFLGDSPSIMRAWISVMISLFGFLVKKRHQGLNSLGIALLVCLLYNPLLCLHIGFQLSFLATAAILIFFQGIDLTLQKVFPIRALSQAILMDRTNQHGYLILCYLRQGFALSIAVNLAATPLVLYAFHKFSFLSLFYNLFFPFLVSLSLLILIFGAGIGFFLPFLGEFLHHFNSAYTRFILNYTYNIPTSMDLILYVDHFPLAMVILHLSLLFCLGIWTHYHLEQNLQERKDFSFL